MIKLKTKQRKILSNPEINKCRDNLDVLYVLKNCDDKHRPLYNDVRKKYQKLLIEAKKADVVDFVEKSDNKSKAVWTVVKDLKGVKNTNKIQIKGDPQQIANNANKFLINIVPELLNNLPLQEYKCTVENNSKSIYVKPATITEVVDIVRGLKNKITSGWDEIPVSIIKYCILEICEPLAHVVNNSLIYGIFPSGLKAAVIKLIHKKGDRNDLKNYRPISILPSFAKVFEVAMTRRITDFFKCSALFSTCQHGYIKGRSIETAIFEFTQEIFQAFYDKDAMMGLFLDLSKAYDCLNYKILIEKLEKYGLRGNALSWVDSYLSGRSQMVAVAGESGTFLSHTEEVTMGIPQGSVVGPLLFVIYVNDLRSVVNRQNHRMICYADDTNLLIKHKQLDNLLHEGSQAFKDLEDWFSRSRLVLNSDKTSCILFRTKQSNSFCPTQVSLNSKIIDVTNTTKFLGIQLEQHLDWSLHIEQLLKKLNKTIYSIRMIKPYINLDTLKTVYFANFQSLLRFGIVFWGQGVGVTDVFVTQKRVLRTMLTLKNRASCRGHFRKNCLLTIFGLLIYETLMFMSRNLHIYADYLSPIERYPIYRFPKHRLAIFEKSVVYSSIRFFNKLPVDIRLKQSCRSYGRVVRDFLIQLEPYSLSEYFDM